MQSKRFQRNIEDFTCEHCHAAVRGDGYTNHCPKCLWSKHVDVNPGDRAATCGGMMEPVGTERRRGENVIVQRCVRCGHERRQKLDMEDSFEPFIQAARKSAEKR